MSQNNSCVSSLSCLLIKYFTVFSICFLIKFYLQIRFLIAKHNFKYYTVYDSLIGGKKALNQNTSSLMPELNSTRKKQQHVVSIGMLHKVWRIKQFGLGVQFYDMK